MYLQIVTGHWCGVIVLNVHASTLNKCDYTRDSFHRKLEHVFDT
jgi:hypothetical protein